MRKHALEIAVPTEGCPGIPSILCRNCLQLVGAGRDGRGCKNCDWYLDWDASWDDVRPYIMMDKDSEFDTRVVEFLIGPRLGSPGVHRARRTPRGLGSTWAGRRGYPSLMWPR
jgi:hypothetical protein